MANESLIISLHDEIDAEEDLAEATQALVARDTALLAQLITEHGFEQAIEAMALLIEDDLIDITTQAVRIGGKFTAE